MTKLKTVAINLVIVFISLVAGVAIAEVGVRVAGLEGMKKLPDESASNFIPSFFMIPDPLYGWRNKPLASGLFDEEGEAEVNINSDGLRGEEIVKPKPEDTFRIALLGDSFTIAVQVPLEQTYAKVMENELSQKCKVLAGKKIEVLNFGANGYSSSQQLLTLKNKVWQFDPDLVMLGFFIGNDVTENSPKLENILLRPFFSVGKNGELVLDTSFNQLSMMDANSYLITSIDRLPAWLVNNVRILQIIKKAEYNYRKKNLAQKYEDLKAQNFVDPPNNDWKQAWEITEELVASMAEETEDKGEDFIAFTIGTTLQAHPDKSLRLGYIETYNIKNLFYPGDRIKALGDREGFPVVNLERHFQAHVDKTQQCLHGFTEEYCGGHWNDKGHELAG
ncbi:MAG: SGNH/GDSL hydrolase family protein, partial [Cyanobacteriota bacterium]|nr:SGNH/GDSL hydrolase family protein [Cyanobacteriota bacterium]